MSLIGTRSVTVPSSSGAFYCPECGGNEYRSQRVRKFMTVTALPILPLGLLGEYVECQICKATFDHSLLDMDNEQETTHIQATFNEAIKRVMVLMMLADKRIEDSEIEAIRHVFHQITGKELTPKDIKREVLIARGKEENLEAYLEGLLGRLNEDGKELVVRAAYLIAQADGHVDASEVELLYHIGSQLELPDVIVNEMIREPRTNA